MKVKHLLGILLVIGSVYLGIQYWPIEKSIPVKVNASKESLPALRLVNTLAGKGLQKLKSPSFAVSDNAGKVYVADSGNHRGMVYDDQGQFLFEFGGKKSAMPLVYPYGIGVVNNRIIVADSGSGAIHEYNYQGEYVKTWLESKEKLLPGQVFVATGHKVYVTDMGEKQILVFSDEGKLLKKIKPSKINLGVPQGLAISEDGSLWVVDTENYNVKHLSPKGNLLALVDGGQKWSFAAPKGLAVDGAGRLYVSDTMSNAIRVFAQNGSELTRLVAGINKAPLFQQPSGLSVDRAGRVYIADQGKDKIQVWAWK